MVPPEYVEGTAVEGEVEPAISEYARWMDKDAGLLDGEKQEGQEQEEGDSQAEEQQEQVPVMFSP